MTILAEDSHGITRIDRVIHDLWFDLGQLEYSDSTGTVVLPLGRRRGRLKVEPIYLMTVGNVANVEVIDRAQIQIYDVARLAYKSDTAQLALESGFPLEIKLAVRDLNVGLQRVGGDGLAG